MSNEIYKVNSIQDKFSYVGLLRNEKEFKIDQYVWFSTDRHGLIHGRIVGIEKTRGKNPDYLYRVVSTKELETLIDPPTQLLKCDFIFSSINEAIESSVKNASKLYKLQLDEICTYFNQFRE